MAFQNIVFPELKLVHGMSKVKADSSTSVFGNGYREYRVKRGNVNPIRWSFPGRALVKSDAQTLIDFYNTVDGISDSFKFKDPDDNKWALFQLEHLSTTLWTVKSNTGSHIFHLDGSVAVYLNDVFHSSITSVTTSNGIPVINIAGTSSGDKIELTGSFYYAARFDSGISYDLAALNNNNETTAVLLGDVSLKEVPEYA